MAYKRLSKQLRSLIILWNRARNYIIRDIIRCLKWLRRKGNLAKSEWYSKNFRDLLVWPAVILKLSNAALGPS